MSADAVARKIVRAIHRGRGEIADTAHSEVAREHGEPGRRRRAGLHQEEALALSEQIYRVARRIAPSREEAEDLVQETYSRAFRNWRSFESGTNLRAWLFRILTNLNIDRGRRDQRPARQVDRSR